ncbi:MAG: histone deacetylase [Phascolarctobacterium sp.]
MAKDSLGLVFFPAFDWMLSPGHPERQERLLYTRDQLEEEGLFDCEEIKEYRPRLAGLNDLQRVHVGIPNISRVITPAHLTSAGGCLVAADAVMHKEVKRAFALVRPPGHHAMRVVHGIRGFCTINIEAIMVEYLRSKYNIKRVAVVDTDVHHGDGSQDVFYHDSDTLYISFHQDGRTLYPGTGFPNEAGSPAAWGTNINLPLLPGTGDEGLHRLYDKLIAHILEDFQPDIIINSAGQDNHFSDPLASMQITAQGYARLADKLKADIAVLEGGYSIESALPYVNTGIILAMAGLDYSKVVEPDLSLLRKQDARCNNRIDQLIEEAGNIYFNRQQVQKELLAKCGGIWQRRKHIYYDEDDIREEQIETVHYCNKKQCHGYFTIQTALKEHALVINVHLLYAYNVISVLFVKNRLILRLGRKRKPVNGSMFLFNI